MNQYMGEALQEAAQCWCDDDTSGIGLDVRLAEAVARRIAAWMDTAAQAQRNADFYRGLVDECAKHLGPSHFCTASSSPAGLDAIPPGKHSARSAGIISGWRIAALNGVPHALAVQNAMLSSSAALMATMAAAP